MLVSLLGWSEAGPHLEASVSVSINIRGLCTSEDGCDISIRISLLLWLILMIMHVSVMSSECITIADWLKVFRS